MAEVEAIYVGLDDPDPKSERVGALAALEGLPRRHEPHRPESEGGAADPAHRITGHISSPVMIECLQRDDQQVIDTMLIAIHAKRPPLISTISITPTLGGRRNAWGSCHEGLRRRRDVHQGPEVVEDTRGRRAYGGAAPAAKPAPGGYALSTPGISTVIIGIGRVDVQRTMPAGQNLPHRRFGRWTQPVRPRGIERGRTGQGGQTTGSSWTRSAGAPGARPRSLQISRRERIAGSLADPGTPATLADRVSYEIWRDREAGGTDRARSRSQQVPSSFRRLAAGRASARLKPGRRR